MTLATVRVRLVTRLAYGDSLAEIDREEGNVAVYGSNGPVGSNHTPNTLSPVVIIGRKGSYGKVQYSAEPVFAIDTTFYADERHTDAYLRWLYYVLSSLRLDAMSDDVGVPGLSRERVYNECILLPSAKKQHTIADYLDQETARIDALIAAKRRMGELLDERLIAVRNYAFSATPGWPLKRLLQGRMAYGVLVPTFVEPGVGVPMVRTYNITDSGRISHDDVAEIPSSLAQEYRRTSLCAGDLVLSVVGSMGRSAVVSPAENGFNLNRPLARIRLSADVPSRLIWHWTRSTHFLDLARLSTGGGTAQPTLNLGDLENFIVGLPQDRDQWPSILESLDGQWQLVDQATTALQEQITRLQEHRQALITAAVTGQLDISKRKAAVPT